MVVKYRVPEFLQGRFAGLSQDQIDSIITGALCSNNVGIIQNVCLDISTTVTSLEKKGVAVNTELYTPVHQEVYIAPTYEEQEYIEEIEEEEVIGDNGDNSGLMDFLNFVAK